MRYNIDPKRHITRVRRFFAGLVLASAMGSAHGQTLTAPVTPAIITPPNGHSFPGRSSCGHARVHLSAHKRRRGNRFLDRETFSPGSDSLPACLRTGHPDRDHFLSPTLTPTTRRRTRFPSATRRGRVCFDTSRGLGAGAALEQHLRARTPLARTPAPFPACWQSIGTSRGPRVERCCSRRASSKG
jgi:hypothetical protein